MHRSPRRGQQKDEGDRRDERPDDFHRSRRLESDISWSASRRGPQRRANEGDLRNEKFNYKVREHSLAKVPALLVVGRKEAADRTVSIRRLGKEGQHVMGLDAALAALADEAVPPDMRRVRQAA